jgi:uncharacterized membrane protein
MKHGQWHLHPHVRSGKELTFGERQADRLKRGFGSWPFLIILNLIIVLWVILNVLVLPRAFDAYPFILLNLGLSWLAAQQGGALQIAANRGDRISSEVAQHTYEIGMELLELNKRQLQILQELHELREQIREQGE